MGEIALLPFSVVLGDLVVVVTIVPPLGVPVVLGDLVVGGIVTSSDRLVAGGVITPLIGVVPSLGATSLLGVPVQAATPPEQDLQGVLTPGVVPAAHLSGVQYSRHLCN